MTPPRVLHLIHHLRVGGAETLLVELLPRLAAAGFEVHVGCLDDRGPLFEALRGQGIPCHFIGRRRGLDLMALWRLHRLLRNLHIDILNTHAFSAGLWGRLAAAMAGTPHVIATFHSVAGWSQPRKQFVCNRLLQPLTERFVAVSESVGRSLVEKEKTRPGLIKVIHNGINTQKFYRSKDPAGDRRRLGLTPDGFLIGLVARCSPEKGGGDWVKAMGELCRRSLKVQGVVVGDGPELATWKTLAAAEGVADRIRFVGMQTDVAPWLAVMDVLVCPSIQESFGLAALEAQAAGVPVVATRVDGFIEMLNEGEDALLVRPESSADLAAAIRVVLESKELAAKLVENGKHNVRRFTIERTAQNYAALYHGLCSCRNFIL